MSKLIFELCTIQTVSKQLHSNKGDLDTGHAKEFHQGPKSAAWHECDDNT